MFTGKLDDSRVIRNMEDMGVGSYSFLDAILLNRRVQNTDSKHHSQIRKP